VRIFLVVLLSVFMLTGLSYASGKKAGKDNHCVGAGPQSPRDIAATKGSNKVVFNTAPDYKDMNLCNVHFHRNAEHKASSYSEFVKDGDHSGWACKQPSAARLAKGSHVEYNHCEGIAPGDTIEVHWVYTTCDTTSEGVKPLGGGLGACMTEICPNPQLRVEAQVFVLEEGGKLKFNDKEPVTPEGDIVRYIGSTTGTSYSNDHCSQFQVNWNVRNSCESLDIKDFSNWCAHNKYNDHHAHGVRELVTSPALLSPIK